MKFAIFIGVIIYYITVLITCPWMILTAALGVFCMDPIEAIRDAVKADLIDFYTSCNADVPGQDALGEAIATIITSFDSIEAALNANVNTGNGYVSADSYCRSQSDNNYVQFVDFGLDFVDSGLGDVQTAIRCPRIRDMIFKFVEEGLCVDLYGGIYSIWASQFTTGFFMFFLIVLASVAYQYYKVGSPPVAPSAEQAYPDPYAQHQPHVQAQAAYEMVPTAHAESGVAENHAEKGGIEV